MVAVGEPQVVVRGGVVHTARLGRIAADSGLTVGEAVVAVGYCWSRALEGLALQPIRGRWGVVGAGQVRVQVRAIGGEFPGCVDGVGDVSGCPLAGGLEGAGVVVEVGPGVGGVAVGDSVMGLFRGGGASVAVADQRLVVGIPAGWSFAQAAGVPVVFLTAYYGLVDLAGVAGRGVGVGACRCWWGGDGGGAVGAAFGVGGVWYCECGKWDTLWDWGFDERSCWRVRGRWSSRQQFLAATGGRGVDVVLDSLAGDFVDASLRLLPRGGRFLEMGKTDIRDAGEVAEQYPGVVYQAFDLFEAGVERMQADVGRFGGVVRGGCVGSAAGDDVGCAAAPGRRSRFLSQARHMGKVVLTMPVLASPGAGGFSYLWGGGVGSGGTVLITGGTGVVGCGGGSAFGGWVWGAAVGVGESPWRCRRRGLASWWRSWLGRGRMVGVVACDVADRDALAEVVAGQLSEEHPLDGGGACRGGAR